MLSEFELKKNGFSNKMQTQYKNASRVWDFRQTNNILGLLAQVDIQLRQSGSGLEDNLLQLMIYSIIIKKGEKIKILEYENL